MLKEAKKISTAKLSSSGSDCREKPGVFAVIGIRTLHGLLPT